MLQRDAAAQPWRAAERACLSRAVRQICHSPALPLAQRPWEGALSTRRAAYTAKSPARSPDDGDPQAGCRLEVCGCGWQAGACAGWSLRSNEPSTRRGGLWVRRRVPHPVLLYGAFPCVTVSPNGYTTRRLGGLLLRARHLCLDGTGKALVLGTIRIPSFSLIYRSRASSMTFVHASTC